VDPGGRAAPSKPISWPRSVTPSPLDRWRAIVERAVTDAEQGDAKARDWLSRYVTGGTPNGLTDLAAYEAAGGIDQEIESRAHQIKERAEEVGFFSLGGWTKK
jgi:hypothetical protein